MAQWHKLHWDKTKITPTLGEMRLHPLVDEQGVKTVKSSHDMHAWHKLDWSEEAATNPETGEKMAHLHDGVVDHIRVVPQVRGDAVSVHAMWHDKDGNIVRQDAHIQY